jgi:hypothetical protein
MAKYEHPLNLGSLVRIVSNVCKWECGKQIFKELVFELKDKKVELVLCNRPDLLGLRKELLLLSDSQFDEIEDRKGNNRFLLQLDLSSDSPASHCRWCAVMNVVTKKIEIQKLDLGKLSPSPDSPDSPVEGCSGGHEIYHVCSFCRKIDNSQNELEILEKTKGKSFQEGLLFSPLGLMAQEVNIASCLFVNGEEMRNLCGLKIQDGKIVNSIGEFDFWQQALKGTSTYEGKLVLPLYCDVNAPAPVLAAENNAILHQLFQIKFPKYPHMPTVNASNILGSDFSNFSLTKYPHESALIIIIFTKNVKVFLRIIKFCSQMIFS